MCGRFASHRPADDIRRIFGIAGPPPNAAPSWNVAPTDPAMVRRHPRTGARHLDLLRWGLVPHFTKELTAARRPINARCETAATSGMFRDALASRRCLVPADAFYEWQAGPDGKQPYAIARQDGEPLAFAALWGSRSSRRQPLHFAITDPPAPTPPCPLRRNKTSWRDDVATRTEGFPPDQPAGTIGRLVEAFIARQRVAII